MFEHDRSAARGEMASRRIVAFKHASPLGNASAHDLFSRVVVRRRVDGELYDIGGARLDNLPPARRYADYDVQVEQKGLPEGIEIVEVVVSTRAESVRWPAGHSKRIRGDAMRNLRGRLHRLERSAGVASGRCPNFPVA